MRSQRNRFWSNVLIGGIILFLLTVCVWVVRGIESRACVTGIPGDFHFMAGVSGDKMTGITGTATMKVFERHLAKHTPEQLKQATKMRGYNGETALHVAAKMENIQIMGKLITNGWNIYAEDCKGRTPAGYATGAYDD